MLTLNTFLILVQALEFWQVCPTVCGLRLWLSFFFGHATQHVGACGILVPRPETKTPLPPALGVRSPNGWTARDVPWLSFYISDEVLLTPVARCEVG